jgi:hypothetical protein
MSINISYSLSGKYGIGKEVLLSNDDYLKLNGKSLCCLKTGYIMIWDKKAKYFHRWLFDLDTDDKTVVDHIDGNKLNCTRENLRLCSVSENMANRKKIGKNDITASKYKGVTKTKTGKWKSNCKKDNIVYSLGIFETEKEAALAYNNKAIELHKTFALLNILED